MTVMIFQLDGSDATLQEGFRTIRTALESIGVKGAKLLAAPPSTPAPLDTTPVAIESLESNGGDEAPASPESTITKRPGRERGPKVVELDLDKGNPNPPLKKFMEEHDPGDLNKRYLLFAYWLKENLGTEEVSKDHMFTCLRHMDWTTPARPAQPLREMKLPRYGWFDKGTRFHYRINHIGEDKARAIVKGEDK